jgi:membrane protease YdiL (CAAX protease family)
MELLLAKGTLVLLSGLLTAGLNMLSMSLVIWRSLSMFEGPMGTLNINIRALGLTYLAAVPTLITFTTLVLIVGLLARTFREANHLATPVMMIPLASMLIAIAEPDMTPGLLVTPVANTTLIIREVLTGRITAGPFVLAFISSMVYAGFFLSIAARVFTNEQLVNPAWEPVSFKGLRPRNRKRAARLPSVDEALALCAIALLLTFYVQPSLLRYGFVKTLFISQIFLLAGPALAMAGIAKYRWIETFSWRKPTAITLLAALLLGIGLSPLMQLVQALQEKIWEPNRAGQAELLKYVVPPLAQFPTLMPILIGVMAGVCEETLFRGPILAGLLRRLTKWPAITTTALLFAAAHLDLYGLPIRTFLGVVLGWIVVHTGSVFPAMVAHASYDITQLLQLSREIRRMGADNLLHAAASPTPVGDEFSPLLLAGAALLVVLAMALLLSGGSGGSLVQRKQIPDKSVPSPY